MFSQVKLLFTLCFTLSQSKDIFSYLKTTVYSCYSCSRERRGSVFFIVSVVYTGKHQIPITIHCLARLSILVDYPKKILFSQVKLLFTVCFTLSQSKDIFSYLKTTVYSCYSCSRERRGSIFFIVSVVYTGKHQIPITIHCLASLSFLVDYPKKILFSQVKLLFTVCFTLSQSKDIFSYLKTTVYSCYSCSRQEGAQFFSSSQLSTQANIRFPLNYTVSLVSVF